MNEKKMEHKAEMSENKKKLKLISVKEGISNTMNSTAESVSYTQKSGDLGGANKIELDCASTPQPLLTMSVSTQLVSSSANGECGGEHKIEMKKTKTNIDNTKMTSTTPTVSSANNNCSQKELKDKTHKYSIMSSTDEQIDKYNAKILKLTDDISKCADEDMVEMMTMTIDGYKNKINALYSEKQKEEKKKISAESEAKLISDFQLTEEFAELVNQEQKRQDAMVSKFINKHKLFLRYKEDYYKTKGTEIGDAYAEWADKVSRKARNLIKGNRVGHNKVDEREKTALRNEHLPNGIVLQGVVRVDVGVKDKSAKPVYEKVNITKVDGEYRYEGVKYDSLNKAWAFAYRNIKQDPKSKSQGSCWALMYCLNKDGTPAMNGKAPHYLKHAKWDLLVEDYDEEYFKDKLGVAVEEEVVVDTNPDVAEGEKMIFGGVAKVGDKVKFLYAGKTGVSGEIVKMTKKTIKVDDKNYSISKISNDSIVA